MIGATYDEVAGVAASLASGRVAVLGRHGRLVRARPAAAVYAWAVENEQGGTLGLFHDAYEAAVWFWHLEAEGIRNDEIGGAVVAETDAHLAAVRRWEHWFTKYRYDHWGVDDVVPFPVE